MGHAVASIGTSLTLHNGTARANNFDILVNLELSVHE